MTQPDRSPNTFSRRRALQGAAAAATLGPHPAFADPGVLNFLAIGDWGRDGGAHQRDVAKAMGLRAKADAARFVLTVGDNFYPSGVQSATDPQWRTSFEAVYDAPSLQVPWYACLGNHDYRGKPDAQITYAKTSPRWRMPSRYYRQRATTPAGQAVDLFIIDTSPLVASQAESGEDAVAKGKVTDQGISAQKAWLAAELARSDAPWKLVFGHHPVFSGGYHGDTKVLKTWLKPLLERHGVQAYVCGHDHDLQHIVSGPVTYVLTGAGSETRPVRRIKGTQFCSARPGFTAYRLAGDLLSVDFVDFTGVVLHTAQIMRRPSAA